MEKWEKAVNKAMGNRQSYGCVVNDDGSIRVHYYGEDVDEKLDGRITRAMAKAGYKWYASGYLFSENRRDNCFEPTSSEVIVSSLVG